MSTKQQYDVLQKRLGTTYGYKVDDDGVFYYSKDLKDSTEVYFSFNDIAEKKKVRYQTSSLMNSFWYIPLVVVVVFCFSLYRAGGGTIISNTVGVLTFLFSIASYWLFKVKNVCIPIEQGAALSYLFFFENLPSKNAGDEIVETIYKARAINYRDRYFRIYESNDKDTEIGRMEWLFREQIISKAEYNMMVDLIKETFDYEEE
jgi:hypothetical protein